MLRLSRDNGYTWGEEKWRDLQQVGKYDARVIWRRLGQFRQVAARFRVTQAKPVTVIGLNADVS